MKIIFHLKDSFSKGSDVKYKFSSRRAFDEDWCQETLNAIYKGLLPYQTATALNLKKTSGKELTINKVY
jgi:hypothetical protein